MANKKKIERINPLAGINSSNNSSNLTSTTIKSSSASAMPKILANLSTGMNICPIDRKKLIPAPSEWNFYSKLKDSKMEELIVSISSNGLLNPIIVWQQENEDEYMILSGHNRNRAYDYLEEYFKDNPEESKKYKFIHANVFKHDQLTDEDAEQIVIDTNWVQRELSPMEKQQSILRKYRLLGRKQRSENGSNTILTRDIIAKDFGLSGRQISKYIKLKDLIKEFQDFFETQKMSINDCVKIANCDENVQRYLFNEYSDKSILKKIVSKLRTSTTIESIKEIEKMILDSNNDTQTLEYVTTSPLTIPKNLEKDYIDCITQFFKKHNLLKEQNVDNFISSII